MINHSIVNNSKLSRVALVVCYFGKLPPYIELVFRSIAANPTIDWLLYSDVNPEFNLPPNLYFEKLELKQLEKMMQEACEIPVTLESFMDVARVRPALGICFTEVLKNYDFWGYTDLDLIYGDLRNFLSEDVLSAHSRIYCRGHLSLFKNTPEVNRYFMLDAPGAPNYRDVFANKCKIAFDEWSGIWKIYRYHKIPQYHKEVIADIRIPTHTVITRFEAEELPNYEHQVFYWHQGKTFHAFYHREGGLFDSEVAYVHFQKRKLPAPNFDSTKVNGFTIGPLGFLPYDRENLSHNEMLNLNSSHKRPYKEIFNILKLRVYRKIRRMLKPV